MRRKEEIKDLGELIRITPAAARVNAGLTQNDVVKALGVTTATVVSWEKGDSEPKISQARQLAELYDIPLANIFFGQEIQAK